MKNRRDFVVNKAEIEAAAVKKPRHTFTILDGKHWDDPEFVETGHLWIRNFGLHVPYVLTLHTFLRDFRNKEVDIKD